MRPSSLATKVHSVNPTDVKDLDDPTLGSAGSRQIPVFDEHGQFRNTLQTEAGLFASYGSGYASNFVATLPAAVAIPSGADGRSFNFKFRTPYKTDKSGAFLPMWFWGSSNNGVAANTFACGFDANSNLIFRIYGTNVADYRQLIFPNFITVYGSGRDLICQFGADSTGYDLRINGIDVTASLTETTVNPNSTLPTDWSTALASSFFCWGSTAGDTVFKKFWPANFRLSLAQAQDVFLTGGGIPAYMRWGGVTDLVNSITNNGGFETTGANNTQWNAFAIWGGTGTALTVSIETVDVHEGTQAAKLVYTGVGSANFDANGFIMTGQGLLHEVSVWGKLLSGSAGSFACKCGDNNNINWRPAFTAVWAQYKTQTVWNNSTTAFGWRVDNNACTALMDSFRIRSLGALFFLSPSDCYDGVGYQLHDVGPNKVDAVIPVSTAITWTFTLPQRRATIRSTLVFSSSGNLQILGQAAVDISRRWRIASVGGNSSAAVTLSLGNVSGGAQYISAQSIPAGDFDLTTFATHLISGANLWVNASAATTLALVVNLEALD